MFSTSKPLPLQSDNFILKYKIHILCSTITILLNIKFSYCNLCMQFSCCSSCIEHTSVDEYSGLMVSAITVVRLLVSIVSDLN